MRLGCHDFPAGRLLVMAVINRTPDSFYGKGRHYSLSNALRAVDAAVADGADIVDIGGVKAAPGPEIAVSQEIERVVPLITEIHRLHPTIVISVDTWRSEVAAASAEAGANLVNDAWGGYDPDLAKVAARSGCGLVCTHEIVAVGWPVLVAVSNKDFIGESLGLPVTERLKGTLAVIRSAPGWVFEFFVHNVREARRAIDMVSVVMGKNSP